MLAVSEPISLSEVAICKTSNLVPLVRDDAALDVSRFFALE